MVEAEEAAGEEVDEQEDEQEEEQEEKVTDKVWYREMRDWIKWKQSNILYDLKEKKNGERVEEK